MIIFFIHLILFNFKRKKLEVIVTASLQKIANHRLILVSKNLPYFQNNSCQPTGYQNSKPKNGIRLEYSPSIFLKESEAIRYKVSGMVCQKNYTITIKIYIINIFLVRAFKKELLRLLIPHAVLS